MRLALSAATLGLVSLAETLQLPDRQGQRALKRDFLAARQGSALSSSKPNESRKPLWKQDSHQLISGSKPCDPSQEEPDVGILAQCAPGYSCQPLPEGSDLDVAGGSICVSKYDDGSTQSQRKAQQQTTGDYDACQYFVDGGYDCNCDEWLNNTGTFTCTFAYPNTTFFGFPATSTYYTTTTTTTAAAGLEFGFRACYTALDDTLASFVESYCSSDYLVLDANGEFVASDKGCIVTMNGQECDSCIASYCNATGIVTSESFDCSNVNKDAVVDDVCGGNTIWKQLLADEYPTPEPVIAPTAQPMTVDTPSPANGDDGVTESPTPAATDGSGSEPSPTAPSTGDAPTTGAQPTPSEGESSALLGMSWSILPSMTGGLIGMVIALN